LLGALLFGVRNRPYLPGPSRERFLHPSDTELYLAVIGPLFSSHSTILGFVQ
jgi:hypothetical protein